MYVPSNLKMESTEDAHEFIDEFSFGVVISKSLEGTHLPFILNRNEEELGTLYGHFAKPNPQWKRLSGKEVLVIFSGPHAYISPTWYATSPAAPTWNYAAVHVYGMVEVLNSTQAREVVEQTVDKYEPSLLAERNILTNEFVEKLLPGIVGIKITISRIEGKVKLCQQRVSEDQSGVVEGLQSVDSHGAKALVHYMLRKGVGIGS
jgi:transcriptional regulator